MNIPVPQLEFKKFIVEAKQSTYASGGNKTQVTPVLSGSHQLEFRKGPFFYRDIYYGGDFFAGQETVYHNIQPIWAMSYSGGINDLVELSQRLEIYDFLKSALREIKPSAPYRGPDELLSGDYHYTNHVLGQISRFSGVESISYKNQHIYQLHYSGGVLIE